MSPVSNGTVTTGSGPQDVVVSGRYAYVTDNSANELQTIDVSNPASPLVIGTITTGSGPQDVVVSGRYAYVTDNSANELQTIDVSNPASPFSVGTVSTGSGSAPYGIGIEGDYAVVVNTSTSTLQTFNLGGSYEQQIQAGAIQTGTLQTSGNANINGDLGLGGGLSVGSNAAINGNLGVSGGTTLQGSLTLVGGIQGGVTVNGLSTPNAPTIVPTCATTPCTASYSYEVSAVSASGGATPASVAGSTSAQYATLNASNYNNISWTPVAGAVGYNVYRTAGGASTGLITSTPITTTYFNDTGISATTTAPTLDTSGQLSVNGSVTFEDDTNSTTAFQVQNASGYNDLTVNSTSGAVTLGNVTSTAGHGVAGSLIFADGTADNKSVTLTTATQANNVALTIPADTNTADTICLQMLANCTSTGGVSNFINNQTTAQTSANFDIVGINSTVTAKIQGAGGTASDIEDLYVNGGSTPIDSFSSTGIYTNAVTGGNAEALTGVPAANATSSLLQLGSAIASGGAGGTYIGVNAPSSNTADLINLENNSVSKFDVSSTGVVTLQGNQTADVTTASSASGSKLTIQPGSTTANGGTAVNLVLQGSNETGTGATVGGAVSITGGSASTGTGGSVTIQGGTGTTNGTISLGTATTSAVNVGNTSATLTEEGTTLDYGDGNTAHTINIGAGGSLTAQTVTLGSTYNGSVTTIQGGTGAGAISIQAGAAGTILVGTTNANTVTIGSTTNTGTLTLGQSTAGETVNIANGTVATGDTNTISIGTTATGTGKDNVTLGSLNAASTTTIQGGTTATAVSIQSGASGTIGIGTANAANTIQIGNTANGIAQTIGLGNNATTGSTDTVTVGNLLTTSTTTIQGGTGAGAISIQAGAAGTILVGTTNANTVTIGSTTNTGTLTLGQSTAGETVNIANGTVATGDTNTISIGTTATGTGKDNVTLGSLNAASTTTIQGGTGDINLITNQTGAGVKVQTTTNNSTTAFQIQNASNQAVFIQGTTQPTYNNLLTNYSFTGGTTGWTNAGGSGTPAQVTTQADVYPYNVGLDSLSDVLAGSGTSGVEVTGITGAPITGNYTFGFYAMAGTAITGLEAVFSGGGTCTLGLTTVSTAGFDYYSCSVTTTSTSNIMIESTASTGQTLYISDPQLETTATGLSSYQLSSRQEYSVNTAPADYQNTYNSGTAFQVQNASGGTVFDIDTTDGFIGVGTATPTDAIDIANNGQITAGVFRNTSGGLVWNGSALEATVDPLSSGTVISRNETTGDTLTVENLYAGSSGNILTLQDSAGTVDSFNSTGIYTNAVTGGNAEALTGVPAANATSSLLQLGSAIASGGAGGTYIGVNAPSSNTADLINLENNSVSKFDVSSTGVVTLQGNQTADVTTASSASGSKLTIQPGSTTANGGTAVNLVLQGSNETGTGATVGGAVSITGGSASTGTGGSVTIQGGTGTTNGTISLGTATTSAVNVGNTSATLTEEGTTLDYGDGNTAHTINIGAGGSLTAQTVTLGSTYNGSVTTIQGGTGAGAISIQAGAAGTILVGTTNANTVTIGSTTNTGTLTLGQSTAGETVNIANGTVATGDTNTISIGTTATGTGKDNVTLGSLNAASTTTIQGGTTATAVSIQSGASGTINVGTSAVSNSIQIGQTGATAVTQTIGIGNGGSGSTTNTTVGNLNNGSTTTIQGGTGAINLNTGNTSSYSGNVVIQSGNSSSAVAGSIAIDTGTSFSSTGSSTDYTFESGTQNFTGWYPAGNLPTVAQSSLGIDHSGSYSLKETGNSSAGFGIYDYGQNVSVTPGQVYTFTAWVHAASTSEFINEIAIWNGPNVQTTVGSTTDNSTGWTEITGQVTAPAGSTSVYLAFEGYEASGEIHYFDDVTITGDASGSAISIGGAYANSVLIGNNNAIGGLTLQNEGISDILLGSASVPSDTIKTSINSASAFQIQDATGLNLLGVDTSGNNLNLGAVGATALSSTVNIATSTGATQAINIGSSTSSTYGDTVTLQGEGISDILTGGSTPSDIIKTTNNSANAFVVQSSTSGQNIFSVNTSTDQALLGSGTTAGALVFTSTTSNNPITLAASSDSTSSGYTLDLPTSVPSSTGLCLESGTTTAGVNPLSFSPCSNSNASITEVSEVDNHGSAITTLNNTAGTIGDLLVVTTEEATTGSVTNVSGGGVTTWSKVESYTGTTSHVDMWEGVITATGSKTVTITPSGTMGTNEITATEFTADGVTAATDWGVDSASAQSNVSAANITYPSLSPQDAGELYIGYGQSAGTSSNGSSTGFAYKTTGSNNELTWNLDTVPGSSYAPLSPVAPNSTSTSEGAEIVAYVASTAINNSTSIQQANFNVQAGSANSVAAVLQAPTTNTSNADIEDFYGSAASQSSSNLLLQVTSAGDIQFDNQTTATIGVAAQTSGTTAGNGLLISAGEGYGTGIGGQLSLQGGIGGHTGATGTGGEVLIAGGASVATAGAGGEVIIQGGAATTSAAGGKVLIQGGISPSGAGGSVEIQPQTDNTTAFQIQNAAGTLNLLTADTTTTDDYITITTNVTTGSTPGQALVVNSGISGNGGITFSQLTGSTCTGYCDLLAVNSSGQVGQSNAAVSLTSPALAYWDGVSNPTGTDQSYPNNPIMQLTGSATYVGGGNGVELNSTSGQSGSMNWQFAQVPFEEIQFQFKAGTGTTAADATWFYSYADAVPTTEYGSGLTTCTSNGAAGCGYIIYFSEYHKCIGITYGSFTDGNQCGSGGGTNPLTSITMPAGSINDGNFHNVEIQIIQNRINVYWDGNELLSYTDVYTRDLADYQDFGFGARSGANAGSHFIKGLLVTKLTNTSLYDTDTVSPLASDMWWNTSSGSLGIGTPTPHSNLEVDGTGAISPQIYMPSGDTATISGTTLTSSAAIFNANSPGDIVYFPSLNLSEVIVSETSTTVVVVQTSETVSTGTAFDIEGTACEGTNCTTGSSPVASNVVTGVNTTFTAAMVGDVIEWPDGNEATITAYTSATSVTVGGTAALIYGSIFNLIYPGLQVNSTGNITIGANSTIGGTVINDTETATGTGPNTYTEARPAYGYNLYTDLASNAATTDVYNITGLPSTEGTTAYIESEITTVTGGGTQSITVEVNGTAMGEISVPSTVASGSYYDDFIVMYSGSAWRIIGQGPEKAVTNVTYTQGADYAEWVDYSGDTAPQPGDVLSVGSNSDTVQDSTIADDPTLIGVVSTNPYDVGGNNDGHSVVLALTGRVPVKVSLQNGPIQAGDPLTSSSTPGVAMKATSAGDIIGTALESYDGTESSNEIDVQLHVGYDDPSNGTSIQGDQTVNGNVTVTGSSSIQGDQTVSQDLAVAGDTTLQGDLGVAGNLNVTGSSTLSTLLVSGNLTTDGDLSVAGSASINNLNVQSATIATNLSILGTTTAANLNVSGTANVQNLTITGITSIGGDIQLTGQVNTRQATVKTFTASSVINAGEAVVLDNTPGNEGDVTTTTTADDPRVIGVAVTSAAAAGDPIQVAINGWVQVNVDTTPDSSGNPPASLVPGELVVTSANAGTIEASTAPVAGSILGKTTDNQDTNNQVWILITLQ